MYVSNYVHVFMHMYTSLCVCIAVSGGLISSDHRLSVEVLFGKYSLISSHLELSRFTAVYATELVEITMKRTQLDSSLHWFEPIDRSASSQA